MLEVGDRVKLSSLDVGDAAEFEGDRIIVVNHFRPDKEQGAPRMIEYYDQRGDFCAYVFQPGRTPMVKYLGTGSVQVIVKFNDC